MRESAIIPVMGRNPRLMTAFLTGAGLLLVTGVALYDRTLPPSQVVIGGVLIGPILVALTGNPRATALVAIYATLAAWISGSWNHNIQLAEYWVRSGFVTFGAAVCFVSARARLAERQLGALLRERTIVADAFEAALEPAALPEIAGWQVAPLYRPAPTAARVGGDFYDAYRVLDGWAVVFGDTLGHGAEAAALTALTRYTLRTAATLTGSLEAAVEKLDRDLRERRGLTPCALTCLLVPDAPGEPLGVLVAGTPPPLLVARDGVREVGGQGPLVGAFSDAEWAMHSVTIGDEEVLVLHSDGIEDLLGADGRFGERRIREALAGCGCASSAVEQLAAAIDRFGGEQQDDLLVLALDRTLERARLEAAAAG